MSSDLWRPGVGNMMDIFNLDVDEIDVDELFRIENGKLVHFNLDKDSNEEDVIKFVRFCHFCSANFDGDFGRIVTHCILHVDTCGKPSSFDFDNFGNFDNKIKFSKLSDKSLSSLVKLCCLFISGGFKENTICVNDECFKLNKDCFVQFFYCLLEFEWWGRNGAGVFEVQYDKVQIMGQKFDLPIFGKEIFDNVNETLDLINCLKNLEDKKIFKGFTDSIHFEVVGDDGRVFGQSIKSWGVNKEKADDLEKYLNKLKDTVNKGNIEVIRKGDGDIRIKVDDKESENLIN